MSPLKNGREGDGTEDPTSVYGDGPQEIGAGRRNAMRLSELDGQLYARGEGTSLRPVDAVPDAQAVMFLCPGCRAKLGTDVGCHSVLVWFADRDVPPGYEPLPRWDVSGTSVADLTLLQSVNVRPDPVPENGSPRRCDGWHGFIRKGEVLTC